MERLKPLNDFIFKKLFGEKGDEKILLSFLNAILKRTHKEKLIDVKIIENKELSKELINDKTGRIDVRAVTTKGEQIDIEVQLTDQGNMDKRTLFYWGKLYLEGIKKGEDYEKLSKVITINLLDFDFLDTKSYHSSFHLWEDIERTLLTDLVEIHFIELPKFRRIENKNYNEEELHRWLTFLEKDISTELLIKLINMEPAIKMAEEKLEYLSSNPETIALYKAREESLHERANMINTAEKRNSIKIAKNLLSLGIDKNIIVESTGLSLDEINKLS